MTSKKDLETLEFLLVEREQLLKKHPELTPLQNEIDRALAAAGTAPLARLLLTFKLMAHALNEELKPELVQLKKYIDKIIANEPNSLRKRKINK